MWDQAEACAATFVQRRGRGSLTRSRARLGEAAQRELKRGTLQLLRGAKVAGHTLQTA